MPSAGPDPKRLALLLVDLQNDVVHPEGAYGRGGVLEASVTGLPKKLEPVAAAFRAKGSWIVTTLLTLVQCRHGQVLIPDTLRKQRPFLCEGDFAAGTWGHRLAVEVAPADIEVEKVSYSGFYMSRLEWVLRQARIETLVVAGVATQSSVASTIRDALMRDFKVVLLEDGCASFDPAAHRTALADLSALVPFKTCREAPALLH